MKDYYEKKSGETSVKNPLDLPSVFMPDNGCQFKPDRMEELGYRL